MSAQRSLFSRPLFFCLALFFLVFANPAGLHAYCPVPEIKPNGEFFKANHVFTGKVVSERYVDDKGDVEGSWFYRIAVSRTFRGSAGTEITVFTGDDSNRFNPEVGEEYLLFAYRSHHRLVIDACRNSAMVSEASSSLSMLQDLLDGKLSSQIKGSIVAETSEVDTTGIIVTLRRDSKIYSAITDKDGTFHLPVPPGEYHVDFSSKEYYLNSFDDFWYNAQGFSIHPGECASLQLVSSRHKTVPKT